MEWLWNSGGIGRLTETEIVRDWFGETKICGSLILNKDALCKIRVSPGSVPQMRSMMPTLKMTRRGFHRSHGTKSLLNASEVSVAWGESDNLDKAKVVRFDTAAVALGEAESSYRYTICLSPDLLVRALLKVPTPKLAKAVAGLVKEAKTVEDKLAFTEVISAIAQGLVIPPESPYDSLILGPAPGG